MDILEKILKEMPEGLNDLEKARYLYIALGETFVFSTKLQNTSEDDFLKMYTEQFDGNNLVTNQVVCRFWAQLYAYLLGQVNIKANVVNSGHQFVTFEYDNRTWIADATYGTYTDLARIKFGDKTCGFGVSRDKNPESSWIAPSGLVEEYLEEIDAKFPNYYARKQKLAILKEKLSLVKDTSTLETNKLKFMFEAIGPLEAGYYESKDFIRVMEHYLLNTHELARVGGTELKRTNKDGYVDIIQCIYVEKKDSSYDYFLLAPNLPVRKVSKADVTKLSILGFGLDNDKIPQIEFPKVFKPGIVSKKGFKHIFIKVNTKLSKLSEYDKEQVSYIK